MRRIIVFVLLFTAFPAYAGEFGIAENSLNDYRSVRYESVYTKVPTTGKARFHQDRQRQNILYLSREERLRHLPS